MNAFSVAAALVVVLAVAVCLRRLNVAVVPRNTATALVAVAVIAAAVAVGTAGTPAADAASSPAKTSADHPFSDPVWWPLRAEVRVDCTTRNVGCLNHHNFYGVDVVPTGQLGTDKVPKSNAGVYAMGAGKAYIRDAHGAKCPAATNSFGTEIWIDHGGGLVSRYGHLKDAKAVTKSGMHVRAGQRIGTVGTSGKSQNCGNAYTDFMLRPQGIDGSGMAKSTEFSTTGVDGAERDGQLFACGPDGERQTWPSAVTDTIRWEDVPKRTVIPISSSLCLPQTVPLTPNRASGVTLKSTKVDNKTVKGALKVSWTAPKTSGVDTVRLELSEYHPSTKAWDRQFRSEWVDVAPTVTSSTFTKLVKGHKYRVRVWFHNAVGWNTASWVMATSP